MLRRDVKVAAPSRLEVAFLGIPLGFAVFDASLAAYVCTDSRHLLLVELDMTLRGRDGMEKY